MERETQKYDKQNCNAWEDEQIVKLAAENKCMLNCL